MNTTALLHATSAVLVAAGFLVPARILQIGLFALAAVGFVAGIVVARRDD